MTLPRESHSDARQLVLIELREVAKLLEAAVEIANGLVGVCEHAYDHDHRTTPAFAAAIAAAKAISEEREQADERLGQLE